MTKVNLENAERLIEQKHLECRADHVPCTVQSTYSNLDGSKDKLVRRELILLDTTNRTVIGIEYDANENPAEIYTTDAKGNKIKLKTEEPKQSNAVRDLIGERLEKATKAISNKENNKPKLNTNPTETKSTKPIKRTIIKKSQTERV